MASATARDTTRWRPQPPATSVGRVLEPGVVPMKSAPRSLAEVAPIASDVALAAPARDALVALAIGAVKNGDAAEPARIALRAIITFCGGVLAVARGRQRAENEARAAVRRARKVASEAERGGAS